MQNLTLPHHMAATLGSRLHQHHSCLRSLRQQITSDFHARAPSETAEYPLIWIPNHVSCG